MTKTLNEGQLALVSKAEKLFATLGLSYAIKLPDGSVRGDLTVKLFRKRPLAFPYGEIKAYVAPFLENIEVGQKLVIPADKYGEARVRSAAGNIMAAKHGRDMATCTANGDGTVTVDFNCGLE